MSASLFDSTAWYRLSNDFTGPSLTLSLGLKSWPPPTPQMTPAGAYSSENWQLFFDSGVYFIRNYDYRGSLQLGITADERSLPEMLSPSGALGMQWNLSQWNGNDGTWKVTNGLLGGEGLVLGVADSGEFDGSTVLAMNADPEGAHWTFDINVSAGRITDQLSAFASLEVTKTTSFSEFLSDSCFSIAIPIATTHNYTHFHSISRQH